MSADDGGTFGRLLRTLRTDRGLSRADIARIVGINAAFYGAVERGAKSVSLSTLARMRQHLQFDANAVLEQLNITVGAPEPSKQRLRLPKRTGKLGPYVAFGRLLAEARCDAQLTQVALARALHLSSRFVIRTERGHSLPSIARFAQWRQILRFDANIVLDQLTGQYPRTPFYGFGQIIKQARVHHRLTASQVAGESGCPFVTYQDIERGVILPRFDVVVHIHRVVGFDANAAFRWLWNHNAVAIPPNDESRPAEAHRHEPEAQP